MGAVRLVKVYETIDPVRGELIRELLESDGIQVHAGGEASGPYRMGPVLLSVSEEDADRAHELIEASQAGRLALKDEEVAPGDAPPDEPAGD
jgi:hypothetical protein